MPARLISHYRIVRRLGAGGMGEVFLAQDTQLDRPVALKVMSPELAKDPNQRKRFRTEARAASGLTHPHICVIYDVGETKDGRPFLAMEYVEGYTLDVILQERRPNMREILNLGIGAAEALDAAHAHSLVHRDIKPANLMVNRQGHVKVMDFGLAKRCAPDSVTAMTISTPAHTRTGMLIGTPQYMSPEQALGHPLDARSDIFSLGAVLYELVAGQRPFLGQTVGESINAIVNQPPAPLGLQDPAFSPALDQIIFKCLEKEPAKRYTTAKELAAELRGLKEEAKTALAAMAPERTPAPVTWAFGGRQPTALWKLAARTNANRSVTVRWMAGFVVVGLLVMGGWVLFRGGGPEPSAPGTNATAAARPKTVAVLPFVNLSADKGDEYLSDSITDELINTLQGVSGLQVQGRASSFYFKGRNESPQRMGEQLRVTYLVEGSASKSGNKLRIKVGLITAADGFQLWSAQFERDMGDFFKVQSEVARAIAAEVQVHLTSEDQVRLARARTAKPAAVEAYLRGMHHWWQWTEEGMTNALRHFERAVEIEPGYAEAHAGLALTRIFSATAAGIWAPTNEVPKGKEAAQKAIALDPTIADAYLALGYARMHFDWDWEGARKNFQRALELSPHSSTALDGYANFLYMLGRLDEAVAVLTNALAADPLSPALHHELGWAAYLAGQFERSIPHFQKALELDRNFSLARLLLGLGYLHMGKTNEAWAELQTTKQMAPDWPWAHMGLGRFYGVTGRRAEAMQVLADLDQMAQTKYLPRVTQAYVCLGLDQKDAALDWLEKAFEEHDGGIAMLKVHTGFAPLRNEPRFQALLKKVGLDQ